MKIILKTGKLAGTKKQQPKQDTKELKLLDGKSNKISYKNKI
jgi:hypothetical protein